MGQCTRQGKGSGSSGGVSSFFLNHQSKPLSEKSKTGVFLWFIPAKHHSDLYEIPPRSMFSAEESRQSQASITDPLQSLLQQNKTLEWSKPVL